jgi:hypothetical protein
MFHQLADLPGMRVMDEHPSLGESEDRNLKPVAQFHIATRWFRAVGIRMGVSNRDDIGSPLE